MRRDEVEQGGRVEGGDHVEHRLVRLLERGEDRLGIEQAVEPRHQLGERLCRRCQDCGGVERADRLAHRRDRVVDQTLQLGRVERRQAVEHLADRRVERGDQLGGVDGGELGGHLAEHVGGGVERRPGVDRVEHLDDGTVDRGRDVDVGQRVGGVADEAHRIRRQHRHVDRRDDVAGAVEGVDDRGGRLGEVEGVDDHAHLGDQVGDRRHRRADARGELAQRSGDGVEGVAQLAEHGGGLVESGVDGVPHLADRVAHGVATQPGDGRADRLAEVGHRRQQAVEVDVVDRRRDRVERAGDLVGHGAQRQAVDHRQHPLFEGEQPTADLADGRVVDRIAEALHETAHDRADVVGTELPVLEPVAQAAQLGDEAVEDRGEAHLGDLGHGAHRRGDGPEPAEVEAPERGHGAGEQSVARGDQLRLGPAGGLEVELERRPVDVRGDASLDRGPRGGHRGQPGPPAGEVVAVGQHGVEPRQAVRQRERRRFEQVEVGADEGLGHQGGDLLAPAGRARSTRRASRAG